MNETRYTTKKKLKAAFKNKLMTTFSQGDKQIERAVIKRPSVTPPVEEASISFWIPKALKIKIKIYAAESGISVKQIGHAALEEYLAKQDAIGSK